MVVKPESKLRQIKIGQIVRRPNSPPRVLHELVYQKAVEGGYKVALLVAADRLNEDAANALLKTLEEPPERTVFILLSTEPERLLDTIRSRCLVLTFAGDGHRQFGERELEWLQGFASMAARGEKDLFGRYRLLGTLLQQLAELNEAIMTEVEEASPLRQHEEVPADLREQWEEENKAASMAEYRYRRANFLAALQGWLRDVWLQASGLGNELAQFPELADSTQLVGSRLTPREAGENLRLLEQTQRILHTNVAELLALEMGLLKLKL
jgi:DNA polymerase-3 subunit delta'